MAWELDNSDPLYADHTGAKVTGARDLTTLDSPEVQAIKTAVHSLRDRVRGWPHVEEFTSLVSDDDWTAAINAAIVAAGKGTVLFGRRVYDHSGSILVPGRVTLRGTGAGDPSSSDAGTVLRRTADVTSISVASAASHAAIEGIAVTGVILGTAPGIVIGGADATNGATGVRLRDIFVRGIGGHAVWARNGNSGRIDGLDIIGCGGHGLYLHSGAVGFDNVNAWVVTKVMALSCGGDGIRLGTANCNYLFGFDCEGNTGLGLTVLGTYNVATGYIEANTAGNLHVGPNAFRNHLTIRSVGTDDPTSIENYSNHIYWQSDAALAPAPYLYFNGQMQMAGAVAFMSQQAAIVGGHATVIGSQANITLVPPVDGSDLTIDAPIGLVNAGQTMTIQVKNATGGALGAITWAPAYKLAGAWTNPANGYSRVIEFFFDGTVWVEKARGAADVPN